MIISPDGRITVMNKYIYNKTRFFLNKIFNNNPAQLRPILFELEKSMYNTKKSNLNINYLSSIFNSSSIIILWNGVTDRNILIRLGLGNCIMLNISAYDDNNNNIFYLKLINFNTNKNIFINNLGYFKKNGRLLSLTETHNIICNSCNTQYVHHPENDVRLTKCIFNYIISKNSSVNDFLK